MLSSYWTDLGCNATRFGRVTSPLQSTDTCIYMHGFIRIVETLQYVDIIKSLLPKR